MTLTYIAHGLKEERQGKEKPWKHYAFDVTLTHEGRSLTTSYRMGVGHEKIVPYQDRSGRTGDPSKIRYNAFGPRQGRIRVAARARAR